jgi:hypothetical protein
LIHINASVGCHGRGHSYPKGRDTPNVSFNQHQLIDNLMASVCGAAKHAASHGRSDDLTANHAPGMFLKPSCMRHRAVWIAR